MTTNEKIAKWLGVKKHEWVGFEGKSYSWINENINKESSELRIVEYLDFIHDRNQQKWIEDKITEKYDLYYYTKDNEWVVLIEERLSPPDYDPFATGMNQSRDLAFIEAVEQLIDKENEDNSPK